MAANDRVTRLARINILNKEDIKKTQVNIF